MDGSFRRHLTNCVLNDENVLFYWCMAGQDEGDENAQKCLEKIVEKWTTTKGFSFANSIMEMYKQEQKKEQQNLNHFVANFFKHKGNNAT